jgi:hypothetical protein
MFEIWTLKYLAIFVSIFLLKNFFVYLSVAGVMLNLIFLVIIWIAKPKPAEKYGIN